MTSPSPPPLPLPELVAGDVVQAAAGLLGCVLTRRLPGGEVRRALIVETEAYHMREPGSHSFRGDTPRTAVMFGPSGHLYVYYIYGMWFCCNVVCEEVGSGAGVLLRAAAPLAPHDGSDPAVPRLRLSGPGLLCRGLDIDRSCNGVNLLDSTSAVQLHRPADWEQPAVTWTRRVGLGIDEDLHWRAVWTGHRDVSKGRPGPLQKKRES
jgi:DNA-3-methyladenine glycosylase